MYPHRYLYILLMHLAMEINIMEVLVILILMVTQQVLHMMP